MNNIGGKIEEDIIKRVREYIIEHGGELEVAKCAEELNLTKEEVRAAIDTLIERGVLEVERGPEVPGAPVPPEAPPERPPEKPRVGFSRAKLGVTLIVLLVAVALVATHLAPQEVEEEEEEIIKRVFDVGYYVKHGENEGRVLEYRRTDEGKWEYFVEFSEGEQTWTVWIEQVNLTRAPDFTLTLSPKGNEIQRGKPPLRIRVWVDSVQGYTKTVSLRAENVPLGVNLRFEPSENAAPFESKMYVGADENAPLTENPPETIRIIGTGADGKIHVAEYIMKVDYPEAYGWTRAEHMESA